MRHFVFLTVCFVLFNTSAFSEGYLARKAVTLPDLVLGTDEAGYQVSQSHYDLVTGKAYSLKIVSTGRKPYALRSDDFFDFIWLRKIEAGDMEIKASSLYELEFEEESEAEIFFVPIKPGAYKIYAAGLEQKGTFTIVNVK